MKFSKSFDEATSKVTVNKIINLIDKTDTELKSNFPFSSIKKDNNE